MDTFNWAKGRLRHAPQRQSFLKRDGQPGSPVSELDGNELGKLFTTLQRRGRQELDSVMTGLAGENGSTGQPLSAFATRNNNNYLGRFKVLQAHLVNNLPPDSVNEKDALRALRWLRRLLEIKKNPALFGWVMSEEQSAGQIPGQAHTESSPSAHYRPQPQPGFSESKKSEKKRRR